MSGFAPREGQRQILEYQGGRMGVSAVPGSGKTSTIAALAARLAAGGIPGRGKVLVVTYQNAAVENLRSRIREELAARGRLAAGCEVRTLHSLSHGLVRSHPDLAGVEGDFQVLDERASSQLLDKAVRLWNSQNPRVWGRLGPDEYYGESWEQEWQRLAAQLARTAISTAKNNRIKPQALLDLLGEGGNPFLRIGAQIYLLYQQQLQTIAGLDFDDLVWLAVDLLERNPALRLRLRRRWKAILEDEAQDSVPLQETLLGLLAGEGGNWVRVGDPNQAIMSTFTASDPRFLRRFLEQEGVQAIEMAVSGRCAPRILGLANHLVEWTCLHHPLEPVRSLAFRRQRILPSGPGDPQQNPPDSASSVAFREYNNQGEEFADVVRRARHFCRAHPDCTLGILVPTNRLGYELGEYLREGEVEFDELLQSGRASRRLADTLGGVLDFLADPLHRVGLEGAYQAVRPRWPAGHRTGNPQQVAALLRSCYRPEALLFPEPGCRPAQALPPVGPLAEADLAEIERLAGGLQRWVRAAWLPVDQLVLTVAQDLLAEEELGLAQKVAAHLRSRGEQHPEWRLPELAAELAGVRQGGAGSLAEDAEGFEPQPGRVTLTTMHKAKGLEWDLVYLVGVDGRWFPHSLEDRFLGERDYLGGDPAAEARSALLELVGEGAPGGLSATRRAHLEIIAERLRLLYVGITRARRFLALSWSREIPAGTRMRPAAPAPVFHLLKKQYQAAGEGEG
jgi:DNA helicase-2/ATP-dependent DNA helicase PcrA